MHLNEHINNTHNNETNCSIAASRQSLPIYKHKDEIISTLSNTNYLIITGETGSGKTTQLPQYIIEHYVVPCNSGNSNNTSQQVKVVITQPRRVAAIQMAKRVAYEQQTRLGKAVGYTIRFDDYSNKDTQIKYVTDGILVKECLYDKYLSKYNVVIIDEAHERSLYSDVLFALVKTAVEHRNGALKLIITSATLNTELFCKYFNNCPIIKISGKLFPVDITYHPSRMEKRVEVAVQLSIRIHLHEKPGHILAFLTGFEECEQACKMAYAILDDLAKKGKKISPMLIMPLYGAQNTEDQAQAFEPVAHECRKLIFCTNIAETSLTVDGIGYVIDCGYVKQKVYNHKTSMDSLMIVPISKVQAIQRAGRAGRTAPGKCLRMYTNQFFKNQMPDVIVPEIFRVNLSSTILTLKSMGIDNVSEFNFIEKPNTDSINEALKQLFYLRAIDSNGKITELGVQMEKFPIDCCYARALIASKFLNVSNKMETLVSLISSENVWINVNKYDEDKRAYFEKEKMSFLDKYSDHMSLLNVYEEALAHNFNDEWCSKHFLRIRALKQARNIKHQIASYLSKINIKQVQTFFHVDTFYLLCKHIESNTTLDSYAKTNALLRIALCQGFYMNLTRKMANANDGLSYIRVNDGVGVTLDYFSSVAVKETKPELVIYTELGGTVTKPVMKAVSVVELKWVNELLIYLKNVDVKKLKGESGNDSDDKEKKEVIDLYKLLDKKGSKNVNEGCDRGDGDDGGKKEEEEIQRKAQEARERYLQRKRQMLK